MTDPQELDRIKSYFEQTGREMTSNNIKQAQVPQKGKKLVNSYGTAPGAFFRQGDQYAFLLPGPPHEMKSMFQTQVRPVLEAMQDHAIRSLTLRIFGVGESDLETRVRKLLDNDNPSAALYAQPGEIHIRITALAGNEEHAQIMCEDYADLFKKLLGDIVYSENDDDLETTVVQLLQMERATVATAESCTGGLLSQRITSVPGASNVFEYGLTSYADNVKHDELKVRKKTLKRYGAVSSQVAAEMAFGAAKQGGAEYGVGITGIAGPDGGTAEKPVGLVYIAVAKGRDVYVRRIHALRRSRELVRLMATQNALDMLRRLLLGHPLPSARRFGKNQIADVERKGKPQRRFGGVKRFFTALLIILLILALATGGLYIYNNLFSDSPIKLPSALGLQYGSTAYTKAAFGAVTSAQRQRAAVDGLITLPDADIEYLVAQTNRPQQQLIRPTATGVGETAQRSPQASPKKKASHTLLTADGLFKPLLHYTELSEKDTLSTFTYFTKDDALVYEVVAVYYFDSDEKQPDNFNPAVVDLTSYTDFLTFVVGSGARNLLDRAADAEPADSYLTLCTADEGNPAHRLYVCGKRVQAQAVAERHTVSYAAAPVMPAAYYSANPDETPPHFDRAVTYWLDQYLNHGVTNADLQMAAGMPPKDIAPTADHGDENKTADDEETSLSPLTLARPLTGATSQNGAPQSGSEAEAESESKDAAGDTLYLTVTMNGRRTRGKAADILAMICQHEVGTAEPVLIKAQAIAAHSWILNQQGSGNAAPAVAGRVPTEETLQAVRQVTHLVVSADNKNPAFTPFYAMAADATNTPQAVWGTKRGYLKAVDSPFEQAEPSWRHSHQLSADQMAELILQNSGTDLTAIKDTARWFSAVKKNDSGYVTELTVGDDIYTGTDFWQRVFTRHGKPIMQSPAFDIELQGDHFTVTAYGVGHGCGLSQQGAAALAGQGENYKQILQHYYPKTALMVWH